MARKSGWQEFAENFQGVYGTFKQIGQDVETGRIMDDEKFTAEGAAGAGLSGSALDKARYKALGDIYTKYGNAKEGLAMRQSVSNLESSERQNELNDRIFENQVRLQGILAENEKRANIGLIGSRASNLNANTREILETLPYDIGILQNSEESGDQANAFTDATQPSAIQAAVDTNLQTSAEAQSATKVAKDPYSWLTPMMKNEADYVSGATTVSLDGLTYLAESERLSSLAKQYQADGAKADRNSYQISAMEEYRNDIESGKFSPNGEFDQEAATSAFLQLTAAFEGQPAATALYNQYVKDGNEAELGKILNKGMILGGKVKNALQSKGLKGVETLFDDENGADFGMRLGEVELKDGTMGIGLIETNKDGTDRRTIAAAAGKVQLGAMVETMTGPSGMIGLAELLYQGEKRALDAKVTNAGLNNTEAKTEYQEIVNDTAKYTAILKQDNLKSSTALAQAQAEKLKQEVTQESGLTWNDKAAQKAFNNFLGSSTYGALAETFADDPARLKLHTNRVKFGLGLMGQPPAGVTEEEWIAMSDADRALFN